MAVLLRNNSPVLVLVIFPVALSVVKTPVPGVVAPMAVELRPVEEKEPTPTAFMDTETVPPVGAFKYKFESPDAPPEIPTIPAEVKTLLKNIPP